MNYNIRFKCLSASLVSGVLLTSVGCNESQTTLLSNRETKESSSAEKSQRVPGLTPGETVIQTAALREDIGLECEAWNVPILERFPTHVLLSGAKSEKLYLRKDYLMWYGVPLILGSLHQSKPSCVVNIDNTTGTKRIQCEYGGGFLNMKKRLLTIPLIASKVALIEKPDPTPVYENWYVLGASLTGENVASTGNSVELVCTPRSPEFGYKVITEEEVRKVQPWDRWDDIRIER